jgi:hypothetical protein
MSEPKGGESKRSKPDPKATDPKHPEKIAVDKYGGDPLNPNEVVLDRIAAVVHGGKKDELVDRWAAAFQAVCPEPVQLLPTVPIEVYAKALPEVRAHLASPFLHRERLAEAAEVVVSGKKHDGAHEWAGAIKALRK